MQDPKELSQGAVAVATEGLDPNVEGDDDGVLDEVLIEDVSIDGMCGVY